MYTYAVKFSEYQCFKDRAREMYVLESGGSRVAQERYIYRSRPFSWLRTKRRKLVNSNNSEIGIFSNRQITIEHTKWRVNQSLYPACIAGRITQPELGEWELTSEGPIYLFDGIQVLDGNNQYQANLELHFQQKQFYENHCTLTTLQKEDFVLFAFTMIILRTYVEWRCEIASQL